MNDLFSNVEQLWENRPGVLLLLLLGFVVFVFLVVDVVRQKQRKKPRGGSLNHHR